MKKSQLLENNPVQHTRKFIKSNLEKGIFDINFVINRLDKREDQVFKCVVDSVKSHDQLRARVLADELVTIKILKTKLLIIHSQLLKQILTIIVQHKK